MNASGKVIHLLFVFIVITGTINSAFAQDSTGVKILSKGIIEKVAPRNIVFNETILLQPKNGTQDNVGFPMGIELMAGSAYRIELFVEAEGKPELTFKCYFAKGAAETQQEIKVVNDLIMTKTITTQAYETIHLDVKKTSTFNFFVGGHYLPAEGIYYKLFIHKL